MTSKEIRDVGEVVLDTIQLETKGIVSADDKAKAVTASAIVLTATMLVEIAAQLAEGNEAERRRRGL